MNCATDCLTPLYQYCFQYHCRYCKIKYPKKWYNLENKQCFFCFHFHSIYHTKSYILKRLPWHYEESHEKNKLTFYEEYMDQLREWCDHYGIEITSESIGLERLIDEEIEHLKYPIT